MGKLDVEGVLAKNSVSGTVFSGVLLLIVVPVSAVSAANNNVKARSFGGGQ
jgi:hypothetical protein